MHYNNGDSREGLRSAPAATAVHSTPRGGARYLIMAATLLAGVAVEAAMQGARGGSRAGVRAEPNAAKPARRPNTSDPLRPIEPARLQPAAERASASQGRRGLLSRSGDMAGEPRGACCDTHTGACIDDVLEYNCLAMGREFHAAQQCGELEPACGDPGCCCDPEPPIWAAAHFEFHANCNGRFISGATPLCGDLDRNGVVNMSDYGLFLDAFGKCAGEPGFIHAADMDLDDCITLVDFQQWRNCYEYPGTGCTRGMFAPVCGYWMPTGLLYAPSEADAAAFRAAVAALINGPVDYFDARAGTPTFEQMMEYAAVLTWVNYPLADSEAMGNRLADYVDHGGTAILGQWCFPTGANYLAGLIMTLEYCPVASAAGWSKGSYAGPGADCVTQAFPVSALSSNYLDNITGLLPGSGSDGTFSNDAPVAAWRPDRRVYYSPGNMGGMYGASGNWAELNANYVYCREPRSGVLEEPGSAE